MRKPENLLEFDADRANAVLDASTDNFVKLAKIAGLNPARDFRHLNLSRVNFSGCNLANFDFTGSRLEWARFKGARLAEAIFDRQQRKLPELVAAEDYMDVLGRPHLRPAFGDVEALAEGFFHSALVDDVHELAKYLNAGVGVDEEFKIGTSNRTALIHIATRTSHYGPKPGVVGLEGAKYLLRAGADVNHTIDRDRWTALLQASHQGAVPLVKLLLDFGANPNAANVEGRTSLHGAVLSASTEIVTMLLEAGANPNHKARFFGTPLECAQESSLTLLVKILRRAGGV